MAHDGRALTMSGLVGYAWAWAEYQQELVDVTCLDCGNSFQLQRHEARGNKTCPRCGRGPTACPDALMEPA